MSDDPNEPAVPGGAANEIAAFRKLIQGDNLPPVDRIALVDQALLLIDRIYVHLRQKREIYRIDPQARLRLLRSRAAEMTDAEFHAELLQTFVELRDLHTIYILPTPYLGPVAFLGILLEQYFLENDNNPHWMVSKVYDKITGDTGLERGSEVVEWNGVPIAEAVIRNGEREPGSNPAARRARGMERMTMRKLAVSPVPGEDWVDLVHLVGGVRRPVRLPWRVLRQDQLDELAPGIDIAVGAPLGAQDENPLLAQTVGLDVRTEAVRQVKKQLFDGAPMPGEILSFRAREVRARRVPTPDGDYGYLRIYSFYMKDEQVDAFFEEVQRLVGLLPENGLIIDVRGNGGGYINAAEFLLRFFTPREIHPEPMQLISSEVTLDLCRNVAGLHPWVESIQESIQAAAPYSDGIALWTQDEVNSSGQIYNAPVVLVTDALCYSATDMFAAGFQDNKLGWVLGTDDTTGAGGANVWTHRDLREAWPDGPFTALPNDAQFSVALRRSLRVGNLAGQPLEDFGVRADERHKLTRRDLLEYNADLIGRAIELLRGPQPS
ncbi:S41 family peptidase [Actinoplanes sp. NPDC051513]|uniref:S41 family peptidase n=1 Tax=Actinoplanes sp. NPDC051513 TaxID=3363908 RepID=UPI003794FBCD